MSNGYSSISSGYAIGNNPAPPGPNMSQSHGFIGPIGPMGIYNPTASIASNGYSIATGRKSVVLGGGGNIYVEGDSTVIHSATTRPFHTKESGKIYLRSDNGVMIETSEPGEFINASEELEKISEMMEELREIKEMISEIYWAAPYGPGFLKAQSHFQMSVSKQLSTENVEVDDKEE